MKKKFFFTVFLFLTIITGAFAQVSSTPEVPRNYKPQPKELLPMPDSLTDEQIFPVLGSYNLSDKEQHDYSVIITRDAESKGTVWVSGLPQGKFKANLVASPATYKIPAQKTLANDASQWAVADAADSVDAATTKKTKSKVISGRAIQEGTLFFDKDANTLYVNIGSKFKEEDPTYAFPAYKESLMDTTATAVEAPTEDDAATAAKTKKSTTKKPVKPIIKGVIYSGSKVAADTTMPATSSMN